MQENEVAQSPPATPGALAVDPPAPCVAPPDVDAAAVQQFACLYGECYDSYLATEPGRTIFWSRDRQGLVSYVTRGPHTLVGGGLLAPPEHKPELLREFVELATRQGLRLVFHNICPHDLPLFREQGFQATKWGEEALVDLGGCTWGGKAFEWVRRQTNYCLRHGLTAFEVRPETLTEAQWLRTLTEVLEVAADSLAAKPQAHEMRFYEGRIGEHALGSRRLFVARSDHGAGRIEGFVVCNPMQNGSFWATEIYRHRRDSVRGTVAFLIHHLLRQFQDEGVQGVSLCLFPFHRCGVRLQGDSPLLRRAVQSGGRFNVLFDLAGLRHFKTRFRPRFEDRYICSLPHMSLGSIWAMLRVFGVFDLNYGKLARILAERMKKRAARATMAAQ